MNEPTLKPNPSDDTPTALIAMSGGVDSSVAAALMCRRGFRCTGVTLKLHNVMDASDEKSGASCGTGSDAEDAHGVARLLGIPFSLLDVSEDFDRTVIAEFIRAYEEGETPNPCIDCNREMKFGKLLSYADAHGIDTLVTGHYARVAYDDTYGRRVLKKAADPEKDQSYVLYFLSAEQLSRVTFPLGELTKAEVRDLASALALPVAQKKESQDICFVPDGNYAGFIESRKQQPLPDGNYTDTEGRILGRHKGIIRYTVGQHKKLGIVTPEPLYVLEKRPESNTVVLGKEAELYRRQVSVGKLVWSAIDPPTEPFRAAAKLRYRQKEEPCTVIPTPDGEILLVFDTPQRAPAKGQAAVIYEGDTVLGGGRIRV